MADYDFM